MKDIVLNNKSVSRLLDIMFFGAFFLTGLESFLHFPHYIIYTLDLVNLIICFYLVVAKNSRLRFRIFNMRKVVVAVFVVMGACLTSAIMNGVKITLVVWACRNTFRYFPVFLCMIMVWRRERIEKLINFLIYFQIPNFIIILIQFLVFGKVGDFLGGIFGTEKGCNAYINIYLCIVVALVIEKYLHKKLRFSMVLFTCFSWMVIAGLTELKIAFVEVPLIIMIAVFLDKPSVKSFIVGAMIIVAVIIGIRITIALFPMWADSFSSLSSFFEVGKAVGGGYNISRFSAFSDINRLFFYNSIMSNLFGLGFGSCEYSSFGMFTSDFFRTHGSLNYRWFSHQMWFLQCGYIGIISLLAFFSVCFYWFTKNKLKYKDREGYGSFGQLMIVLLMINFIYNSSLSLETGYIAYTALAIPFIYYKELIIEDIRS